MTRNAMWRYETKLLSVLCLTFGFVFIDRNAVNYLAPFIAADLHLSNTQIGMLASALSLTWALSGYIGGAISDRTGKRKTYLLVAVVLFSLCSFSSGLATSFFMLMAARLLMGLSEGPVLPISQSLIALESSESRRGLNAGVMQNLGSNLLGSFVAPLALVALANAYGWRVAFYLTAVPGLILAVLLAKYVREPKTRDLQPAGAVTPVPADQMRTSQMFKFSNMWICILMSCFMVAWMVLNWAFLPLYYVNVRHVSASDMSILMSVLGVSAGFFSFVVPGLSDKIGRKPIVIAFCLIGVLTPLAALYYQGSLIALGVLLFVGWSASGTFPLFMATIPSETIPARYIATSLGLVMGIGELAGGVTGPYFAGVAADKYGLQAPMLIATGCALAATALAVFLKETAPVKVKKLSGSSLNYSPTRPTA